MITDTMTKNEVTGQFRKDFSDGLQAFIDYKGAEWLKVRKRLLPKQCGYKIYPFSMDRQKYLLTYFKSRDLMSVNSMTIFAVVKGYSTLYYILNPSLEEMCAVTSHFLCRYAERTGFPFSVQEALGRFSVENAYQKSIYWTEDRTVFACRQGLILAEWDKKRNFLVWKTFVSLDMLKDTQREAYEKIIVILDVMGEAYSKAHSNRELIFTSDIIETLSIGLSVEVKKIYAKYWEG